MIKDDTTNNMIDDKTLAAWNTIRGNYRAAAMGGYGAFTYDPEDNGEMLALSNRLNNTYPETVVSIEPEAPASVMTSGSTGSTTNPGWNGGFNAAEASERILADEEGGETNLPELIDGKRTDLGELAQYFYRKAQDSSLYAQYMYSASDWADKGKWIFDKTGIDVNSLGNKEAFEKAWKLANEIDRQEKLATDKNGHVDMDKVYEALPYLWDIYEANGSAAAVQVMNSAPGLRTINDVYDSEASRFAASIGYGVYKGGLGLMNQLAGLRAMARGVLGNEGLTQEEMREIVRRYDEISRTPQFSYSSVGGALGGILGSAAENWPIYAPEMVRGGIALFGGPVGAAVAASPVGNALSYASMAAQIAGSQYIENLTKTDENGNPIYTPRQAAALSFAQGLAEGALEKRSLAAAGSAIFGAGTAKKLSDLYAKEGILAAGSASSAAREILRERVRHGFRAGILSGAAELEEEFEQQVSDMVLENIAQVMTRGAKADVSSMEEILSESFGAAVEAIPAVAGFALIGAGGSVVADTRRVLDMRSRFEAAEANRLQRAVFENEHQKNIVFGVAQNLNNISDLEGKSPEVVTEILNSQNSKFGVEDSEVDIGVLMQQGHADIVDAIAKEAGKTPEDIQASMNGVQYLTVKTSALQKAISKMTPDQMKVLDPHITANGRLTDYRAVEFAKNAREALKSLQEKTDTERQEIVDRFVKETFPDSEETQNLARELITEDIDNPRAAVNRRIRSVQKSIDEFLDSTKATLKQGSGQGVDIVTNEDGTTGRASNNAEWYRNFYEDMGRAPTQAELEKIAYDNLTGTATRYAAFSYGELSPEDQAEISRMKGELDALFAERQNLRTVSDALRGFEKGDFLVTASMTPEAREVFNTVNNILGQHANEDVRSSARMSAVLAARQLSRLAEAWREAGRNVTASELLPLINVNGQSILRDKSALSQAVVNQQMEDVRRQYEGTDQWMKAPNGQPTKLSEEQWLIVRTPAFKAWFGDWEKSKKDRSKVLDENGEPKVVHHGTGRADRVGSVFRPDRATSGPMAFFTDSFDIATNYSKNKQDTSLSRDEDDYLEYKNQFTVQIEGRRNPMKIGDAWWYLSKEQRDKIAELAPSIGRDENEEIAIIPGNKSGLGGYDYHLKQFHGNHMKALIEEWLQSAALFDEEEKFLQVLKLAGLDNVQYNDPYKREEAVYSVFLNIRKPFDATNINKTMLKKLESAARKAQKSFNPQDAYNADNWDKTNMSPEQWIENVHDDIEYGTTLAWTVVPDFVTETLKKAGYDGIQDRGGKNGGADHTVYIPFTSTQVKSATNNNGQFSVEDPDIYHQSIQEIKNEDQLKEDQRQIEARNELLTSGPVVNIQNDELGNLYGKEQRKQAKKIFAEKYPTRPNGRPYEEKTKYGETVLIPQGLFREIQKHSADPRMLRIVPYLKEIINNSIYLFEEPPDETRNKPMDKFTLKYRYYACKVNIDNDPVFVRSTIRKAADGKYYYDVTLDNYGEDKKRTDFLSSVHPLDAGTAQTNRSLSASMLSRWFEKVNAIEQRQKYLFIDTLKQSAWHGTGAIFEEFDLGYVGSGEGAQAHGYGVYLSGGRNVAEGYRNKLSGNAYTVIIDGQEYVNDSNGWRNTSTSEEVSGAQYTAIDAFARARGDLSKAISSLTQENESLLKNTSSFSALKEAKQFIEHNDEAIKILQTQGEAWKAKQGGSLFEVEIPENDVLLDEQKTFSKQSAKVKTNLQQLVKAEKYFGRLPKDFKITSKQTGLKIYDSLVDALGSKRAASELLNKYGIEGITYDGEQDGRCYVIFNDKAISIINRYNQEVNGTDRGAFSSARRLISLFESADESTFMHEMAHFYLSELEQIANIAPNSQAARDIATVRAWAEWKPGDAEAFKDSKTAAEFAEREKQILAAEAAGNDAEARRLKRVWMQEKFARGFETYLASGKAPTSTLQRIFNRFKRWLKQIYGDVTGAGVMPSAEVAAVMDRMIVSDEEIDTMAIMRDASMISDVNPDLLDSNTADMLDRWKEEANEEAKGKLLKELLKEYREKDVDAHMKDFEEMKAERLQDIPAFRVQMLVQEAKVPEADAAAVEGYSSVEAWKEDLAKNGGSYEAALAASLAAERDRYIREMPNDEHIMELAEEAMHSSDAEGRIAALESEILARRQKRYEKAPARLAKAMDEMESAIETAETEEPLEKALRTLEYSFRWQAEQKKQIEDMRETISAMKEEVRAGQEALQSEKKSREESESAIRDQAQKDKEKLRDRMKEKLKKQVQQFKAATMQNAKWLRGVRDAALGMYKMNREMAKQDLAAMPAKDATNFRLWANQAKQAAQQAIKFLTNAVRKNNGKKKDDTGERDYEAARQAKIRQSVLDARAQEAIKLKRELKRIVDHLKRRSKTIAKDKRGEIDASTRYYINHILYMLSINKSDAIQPQTLVPFNQLFASLKDKFDTQNAANGSIGDLDMDFEVPQWISDIATSTKTPPEKYNEYTMPEIRDIRTLVDILYTTSRNKYRLLTMDKSMPDVISDLIEDWQKTVTVEDGNTGISKQMAKILQPQVMLKTMGAKFKEYLYDTLADAWEQQTARQQEAAGYLNALFDKHWPKKSERRKMRKDILPIKAPDGTDLTKENVLMIALNWGNEGNRLRVVNGFTHDGFVCTETDVRNILQEVMTANDWAFVQEVWDYLNRLGDSVNEVVEKSTGAPMKRVESYSFTAFSKTDNDYIQLRGGYYPIVYDPEKSVGRAEQELMTAAQAIGGASTFGTGLGSTKARSETGLQESPLLLSMDTLFKHVNQQIHISTMRLACRDAYKILTDSNVQGMMTRTLGIPAYREMKRWIENVWQEPIADGNVYTQFLERIRGKTVGAIMAYRTSVSLLNLANPAYMAREMGVFNAFCALSDFYLHPSLYAEKRRWVKENSPFMANRAHNIDRDLNQSKQNSFDPGNPISSMISDYANWLIEETDMMCSMPTYWWTYQQTLNAELGKGTDQDAAEKIAHRAAEDIVRKIFGSSDAVDQSSIQRSKELIVKAITPFYTFTSTQANALWEQIYKGRYQGSDKTVTESGEIQARKKSFFRRYWGAANSALWTYMIGTLIEQMLRDCIDYLTGGDDKDKMDPTSEAFLRRWASQSMTTFTSAVPVLNMFGEYLSTKILGQRYSGRNFGVIDASLNRLKDAFEYSSGFIQGKKDAIDAGRAVAKAIAGSGFGMPDTFTDAIFNAARAYVDHYSFDEWFWKSLFDRKLKRKGR